MDTRNHDFPLQFEASETGYVRAGPAISITEVLETLRAEDGVSRSTDV